MKTSISIVSMGLFLLVYSANGEEQVVREDDKAFHEACYPWERIPIDKIADKQRIPFEGDAEPEGIPLAWVVDLSDLQNQVRTKIPSQSEFSVHRIGDITGKMYVDVTTNDAPSLGDVCKMYFSDSRNLYYALFSSKEALRGRARSILPFPEPSLILRIMVHRSACPSCCPDIMWKTSLIFLSRRMGVTWRRFRFSRTIEFFRETRMETLLSLPLD